MIQMNKKMHALCLFFAATFLPNMVLGMDWDSQVNTQASKKKYAHDVSITIGLSNIERHRDVTDIIGNVIKGCGPETQAIWRDLLANKAAKKAEQAEQAAQEAQEAREG